jgi:hypothetical protein
LGENFKFRAIGFYFFQDTGPLDGGAIPAWWKCFSLRTIGSGDHLHDRVTDEAISGIRRRVFSLDNGINLYYSSSCSDTNEFGPR